MTKSSLTLEQNLLNSATVAPVKFIRVEFNSLRYYWGTEGKDWEKKQITRDRFFISWLIFLNKGFHNGYRTGWNNQEFSSRVKIIILWMKWRSKYCSLKVKLGLVASKQVHRLWCWDSGEPAGERKISESYLWYCRALPRAGKMRKNRFVCTIQNVIKRINVDEKIESKNETIKKELDWKLRCYLWVTHGKSWLPVKMLKESWP